MISRRQISRPSGLLSGLLALIALPWGVEASPAGPDGRPRSSIIHPALRDGIGARMSVGRSPFLHADRPGWVRARIRASDARALETGARRLGAELRSAAGEIASVDLPASALDPLAALPGVISVKPARSYRPALDISAVEVGAGAAAATYGGTGKGAIVAVIDSGIDFRHPDFRNADGTSRVLAVWDQTDSFGGGAGCGAGITFGRCWTKGDLDADLAGGTPVGLHDSYGHGTHVAGIAAGNGHAPGAYVGVAPESDLIIVKALTDSGAFDGDLPAAYSWIAQQAAAAGEPFVINMSLGTDLGPHDGTDPDEIALDAILAPGFPGRAAAIAAGNSRGGGIHVAAAAAPGGTNIHPFQIPSYTPLSGADNDAIYLDMWYEGGDDLTVSLLDASNNLLASAARGAATGIVCTPKGAVVIDATNSIDPDNSDSEVFIAIADDSRCSPAIAPPSGQTLKIRVTGVSAPRGGGYHIWSEAYLGPNPTSITFQSPAESTLVGSPACSLRATTVGAYVTRSCWPNADPNSGTTCRPISGAVGAASSFSSGGPTRDGRLKPEVAAPGEWVVSALGATRPASLTQKSPDGMHWGLRGTSMAAPHAAGALAVILQFNPGLDAVQARDALAAGARADALTGVVPNAIYGAGKMSVLGGAEAILKLVSGVSMSLPGALEWAGEPHSATYNLYRGDLPGTLPGSYGMCLISSLPVTTCDDPAIPLPGAGFFYLIAGVKDGIEGSLGFDSAGRVRPNTAPCL